jgi:hypothetical protein
MNKFLVLITMIAFSSFSQEKNECDEYSMPYWANGINSKIKGENPTLRNAFKNIKQSETEIKPSNGFITLRINVSKTGKICNIETFQIDEGYENTQFNNGELIKKLKRIAKGLTNWKKDKEYKTYNLIRLKIKNGKIEEIF